MGNNQRPASKGDHREKQGHKERHKDWQAGDLRQSVPVGIFTDRAGPVDQGGNLISAMVAVRMNSHAVNVKRTGCRCLEIKEAARRNALGHQTDADQQAHQEDDRQGRLTDARGRRERCQGVLHGIVLYYIGRHACPTAYGLSTDGCQ